MMDTGLPQPTLAKIWQQADQDGDGKLSRQEFIAAMCLCEAALKVSIIREHFFVDIS